MLRWVSVSGSYTAGSTPAEPAGAFLRRTMAEPRSVPRKLSAGVILVDPEGRVLLQLRDDDPAIMYPGHWGITGGAGAKGESPEQTARREVREETGLTLGTIEPFKAYYSSETAGGGRAPRVTVEYELYLYHAPCDTLADAMACGEGRALRFFAPHELPTIDVAYNHREVLAEFFASPLYPRYLRDPASGGAHGGEGAAPPDLVEHFRAALDAGDPWFDALMQAIALWEAPEEAAEGRRFRYLVGGEAFDWLLLAERLLTAAGDRVPEDEAERLLFEARPPAPLDDERLQALIGPPKHRAHLNYLYGVIVEDALQYAVELEVLKERRAVLIADGRERPANDPVFERIYGRSRDELLHQFREETHEPHAAVITLAGLREFTYWLFKYRVRYAEPARVASDTRKALAQLSAIQDAARRRRAAPRAAGDTRKR